MRFSSVAVAGSGFAAPVGKAAGRRGKLPLVVEHREKELPRLGELGDPLRGPDVGRTVVGVGEAQQAPEPALDVLTVDAAPGPRAAFRAGRRPRRSTGAPGDAPTPAAAPPPSAPPAPAVWASRACRAR